MNQKKAGQNRSYAGPLMGLVGQFLHRRCWQSGQWGSMSLLRRPKLQLQQRHFHLMTVAGMAGALVLDEPCGIVRCVVWVEGGRVCWLVAQLVLEVRDAVLGWLVAQLEVLEKYLGERRETEAWDGSTEMLEGCLRVL